MDSYYLQLRNWLSSSVPQTQKLMAFWIKQQINLKHNISFALFFNVCKYSLELFLWNENKFHLVLNILIFKFSYFQDSLTLLEYQLYFFINNYSKHFRRQFVITWWGKSMFLKLCHIYKSGNHVQEGFFSLFLNQKKC